MTYLVDMSTTTAPMSAPAAASAAPEVDLLAAFEKVFGFTPVAQSEDGLNAYQREMQEQATQNKVDRWLAQRDYE